MLAETNFSRRRFLGLATMTIAATPFNGIDSAKARSVLSVLAAASTWLNSKPLTASELQGKIVLVDFWTYSCINWRRQFPYVRAWAEKYKDQGLVVIGVHTPEFSFEKNIENVRWATQDMGVTFPVVMDNDYAIWRGFNNAYWPALYFLDGKGRIRHTQFGEGEYDQAEKVIQKLLSDAGAAVDQNKLVSVEATGAEANADWKDLQSGENYVNYVRTEHFSSPGGPKPDINYEYLPPKRVDLNSWALSGKWTIGRETAALNQAHGRILYTFHARDLHLVMGPSAPGMSVPFRVLIDGHVPGTAHGVDLDAEGNGMLRESRMYQLIRQPTPILDRQFEIEFFIPGAQIYSFTFG